MDVVGFDVVFERRPERFAYLALEDAELMLQEAAGPGRRFRTATLERPFGRGINLQIAVGEADAVLASVLRPGVEPVVAVEDRWYDVDVASPAGRCDVDVASPAGRWNTQRPARAWNRHFVVSEPDEYLLRFYTSLGVEPR